MSMPAISFVVPVRNDAVRLRVALMSIHRSTIGPEAIEIVVVDNGSVDRSVAAARELGAIVIERPQASISALRNAGAAVASGELLAFVDSDHELAPGWVAAALSLFKDRTVGAGGSPYSSPPSGTWVQRTYDRLRHREAGRTDVTWLGSGNMIVPRRVFAELGRFDWRLVTCEDVDLCARIRARGLRIVSDNRLTSIHHGDPATLVDVFRVELWRGRDNFRVSLRSPRHWRSLTSLGASCAALTGMVLVLAAPAAGSSHATAVFATGSILLGSVVLLRAGRLLFSRSPKPPAIHALLVAAAYEMGRAIALVIRLPHRRRHEPQPTAARTLRQRTQASLARARMFPRRSKRLQNIWRGP